jgi:hypothetical protein
MRARFEEGYLERMESLVENMTKQIASAVEE